MNEERLERKKLSLWEGKSGSGVCGINGVCVYGVGLRTAQAAPRWLFSFVRRWSPVCAVSELHLEGVTRGSDKGLLGRPQFF